MASKSFGSNDSLGDLVTDRVSGDEEWSTV